MIHYYPIACVFSVLSGLSTLPTLVPGFCIRPHPSHALDDLSPCHRSGEICILKKGAAHLLVGIPSSHYYLRSLSRTSGTLLLPRFSGPPRGSQEDFLGRERDPQGGSPRVREDPLGTPPSLSAKEVLREPREGPENLGRRRVPEVRDTERK